MIALARLVVRKIERRGYSKNFKTLLSLLYFHTLYHLPSHSPKSRTHTHTQPNRISKEQLVASFSQKSDQFFDHTSQCGMLKAILRTDYHSLQSATQCQTCCQSSNSLKEPLDSYNILENSAYLMKYRQDPNSNKTFLC